MDELTRVQHDALKQTPVRGEHTPGERVAGDAGQQLADVPLVQGRQGLSALLRVAQPLQISWEENKSNEIKSIFQ